MDLNTCIEHGSLSHVYQSEDQHGISLDVSVGNVALARQISDRSDTPQKWIDWWGIAPLEINSAT